MKANVPTLSPEGWLKDLVSAANKLMDYFLASEHSQSDQFKGHVTSFPYLVQQSGHDPNELESNVQIQLSTFLRRTFEEVNVQVDSNNLDSPDGRYNLTIDVMITDKGKQYSLGRLIEIGESKILAIQSR